MTPTLHKLTQTRRRFLGSVVGTVLATYLSMPGSARSGTTQATMDTLPAEQENTMLALQRFGIPKGAGSVNNSIRPSVKSITSVPDRNGQSSRCDPTRECVS